MCIHTLDHVQVESESEVHEEQVPEVLKGPQASNCVDTNIAFEQGKPRPVHPTNHSWFFFQLL
jgi:hypothetical protein